MVATEVMLATPAIRNLIREGKTHQIYSAMQAGAQHGMHTMDQHLADLVKNRRITYEHGLEKCHHVEDFNRLTGRRLEELSLMATATKTYQYSVRDRQGKMVNGKLDAPSEAALVQKLRGMGFAPVSVKESSAGRGLQLEIKIPGSGAGQAEGPGDHGAAVRDDDQFRVCPCCGRLTILAEQTENKKLAETVGDVRNGVESGNSLSNSLAKHPNVFPPLMVNMCRAGEVGGFLDGVLLQIAENYEAEVKLRGEDQVGHDLPGRGVRRSPSSP